MTILRKICYGSVFLLMITPLFFSSAMALHANSLKIANESASTLPPHILTNDVYIRPIGAFSTSLLYTTPNNTYDIDYFFYSQQYAGTVTYSISAYDGLGFISEEEAKISIDPASFTAEPNHVYKSQLHVITGPAFASPEKLEHFQSVTYSIAINLVAILQDNSPHFGNDITAIHPPLMIPGRASVISDRFTIGKNNRVFDLKAGDTYNIPFEFTRVEGIGEIVYNVSDTPLNVTVIPSKFIAGRSNAFPAIISVSADPMLTPGNYSFSLDAVGSYGPESGSQLFYINVTPLEKQSPLPIALPFLAVVVIGLLFNYHWKKQR